MAVTMCIPAESCRSAAVLRMLDAGRAMQQLERGQTRRPASGQSWRCPVWCSAGLLMIPILWLLGRPASVVIAPATSMHRPSMLVTAVASVSAEPGRSPVELRQQPVCARPAAETLGSNIRGYYSRVPGGFERAVGAARGSAAQRTLDEFPALGYELLERPVPVVHGPADLPANGRIGGYFSPEKQEAYIAPGLSAARVQEVVEHELTHAWQFAQRGETGEPRQAMAGRYRYHRPLGSASQHHEVLDCMFSFKLGDGAGRCAFVRDYLCRPSEIDVRLAAFKRWWAWNQGELFTRPEQVREALDHPRAGQLDAWSDVNDAVRIWDSYRNQPEVRELLLQRMLQVL